MNPWFGPGFGFPFFRHFHTNDSKVGRKFGAKEKLTNEVNDSIQKFVTAMGKVHLSGPRPTRSSSFWTLPCVLYYFQLCLPALKNDWGGPWFGLMTSDAFVTCRSRQLAYSHEQGAPQSLWWLEPRWTGAPHGQLLCFGQSKTYKPGFQMLHGDYTGLVIHQGTGCAQLYTLFFFQSYFINPNFTRTQILYPNKIIQLEQLKY